MHAKDIVMTARRFALLYSFVFVSPACWCLPLDGRTSSQRWKLFLLFEIPPDELDTDTPTNHTTHKQENTFGLLAVTAAHM